MGKKSDNPESSGKGSDGEEEEEYAVEKIIDRRVRKGKVSDPYWLFSQAFLVLQRHFPPAGGVLPQMEGLRRNGEHLGARKQSRLPGSHPAVRAEPQGRGK